MDEASEIATFEIGDQISLKEYEVYKFDVLHPGGSTTSCVAVPDKGGLFYIDYAYYEGSVIASDDGLPKVVFKTQKNFDADEPYRAMILKGKVSCTGQYT